MICVTSVHTSWMPFCYLPKGETISPFTQNKVEMGKWYSLRQNKVVVWWEHLPHFWLQIFESEIQISLRAFAAARVRLIQLNDPSSLNN